MNLFRGFHTSRKLLIIEVDDFGTSQYTDVDALESIKNSRNKLPYFYQHDRLESYSDLSKLFEVLTSVKDKNGNHAVFTPLTVMSNPNKDKILESGIYQYEVFSDTIKRIHGLETWNLWLQGVNMGIFVPEFHGREHLNTDLWMKKIFVDNHLMSDLFQKGIFVYQIEDGSSVPPYTFFDENERLNKVNAIESGLKIFKDTFGREAVSYTPPAGGYAYSQELTLSKNGVKAVQLSYQQKIINDDNFKVESKMHYYGERSRYSSIIYTPRNAVFEPHSDMWKDCVSHCLAKIDLAFKLRKPAIVSSHRVNFIENELSNKINGLEKLATLLKQIVKRWPDVEFLSSADLITEVKSKQNS